ncbi:MAG: replication-relaxation family protein [Phycisphaerales bacterium]
MSFRLRETDCRTLAFLAEYRTLTPAQITALHQKGKQAVWRRLRILEKEGLIGSVRYELGRRRGRPERLLGLMEHGVSILKERGLIRKDVPYEKVAAAGVPCVDHQLSLNWFRIHLTQVERVLPRLSVRVLAHNSPFLPESPDGGLCITDHSPVPGSGTQGVKFTPDAVFVTCDSVVPKACLFFLEVDCGTETIASPKRDLTDIRQKVINYQWYFQSQRYKRYEDVFQCRLRGFRLLFLTNSLGRLTALCRLTQEIPPSNFVWLTECSRLFPEGVSAEIWAKGGDLQGRGQSILGSLCCPAPLP